MNKTIEKTYFTYKNGGDNMKEITEVFKEK